MSLSASTVSRRLAAPAALAFALGFAACSGELTRPGSSLTAGNPVYGKSATASGTLAAGVRAQGLLRTKSLQAVKVTQVISSEGGTISIPSAGFTLEVPAGAFDGPSMTFTVTALAGLAVAYDFQPHGAVFNVPLRVVQSLFQTTLKNVKPGWVTEWSGAYFAQESAIDSKSGLAVVSEFLPVDLSVVWTRNEISFGVSHFSGYMVCTGREEE